MLYSKNAHCAEEIPEVIQKNKNSKGLNLKIENFNKLDLIKKKTIYIKLFLWTNLKE